MSGFRVTHPPHGTVYIYKGQLYLYSTQLSMQFKLLINTEIAKINRDLIITLFQEDNIFGTDARLTYGPQLTNVDMLLKT